MSGRQDLPAAGRCAYNGYVRPVLRAWRPLVGRRCGWGICPARCCCPTLLLTCLHALGLAPTRTCHSLAPDLARVVSARRPCLHAGHLPRPSVVAVRVDCAGSSIAWVRLCLPLRRERAAGRRAACTPGVRMRKWAVERRGRVGMCAPACRRARGVVHDHDEAVSTHGHWSYLW
ncbi:uncharacterized protein C8Q71DRAFT_754344 [Rhodofomes roseus]|uniref:Uncharacterized protein n=1 Tax=Rhodofomes roseus TaxID=34475 RepID=A0ABQ8KIR7_9APHY|nr:uncharacterized protein C8Q71DRAFT_754344 [Rhodofomes roseus]KAH9837761.1 hypothetical protein C8Q71DRAFT_754344 [Rhodofomes roseus]